MATQVNNAESCISTKNYVIFLIRSSQLWILVLYRKGCIKMKTVITVDRSIRAKITDICGLSCSFCHNEGTLVRQTNSSRVSVFSEQNHCMFNPGEMVSDSNFLNFFHEARQKLDINEVHLTGGEPSLNIDVANIVSSLKLQGFIVKMTSNGETGGSRIKDVINAGINAINFSVLGLTEDDFKRTQNNCKSNLFYQNKIKQLHDSVDVAIAGGIKVGVNLVISDFSSIDKAIDLIKYYKNSLRIKLLSDLSNVKESELAINELLLRVGAVPKEHRITAGISDERFVYETRSGIIITNKKLRRITLKKTCLDCPFSETECIEGFYGPRVYIDTENNYFIGFCIMRMDHLMPYKEFFSSQICDDILSLRNEDYKNLSSIYS